MADVEVAHGDGGTGDEILDRANGLSGKTSDGNSSSEESEWEEVDGDADVHAEASDEKIETDALIDCERLLSVEEGYETLFRIVIWLWNSENASNRVILEFNREFWSGVGPLDFLLVVLQAKSVIFVHMWCTLFWFSGFHSLEPWRNCNVVLEHLCSITELLLR